MNTLWHNRPASTKKVEVGGESPNDRGQGRTDTARLAAFAFGRQFLAARMGGRKPCRFRSAVAGLSHPSGLPPYVRVGAAVVINDRLEPCMAAPERAPAHHTPTTTGEQPAINLHEAAKSHHACGFEQALTLNAHQVANIAARLRAIHAVNRVLFTEEPAALVLGDYIRVGLLEAVAALATDAHSDLERANTRATH